MVDNNELSELYQEVIFDHNQHPRNYGQLTDCTHYQVGHNPLCGDKIEVFLLIKDDTIQDIKFKSEGCAISKSSASIMTTLLKNKSIAEVKSLFTKFHDVVTSEPSKIFDADELGKLSVFCGVREFPARVKCATLA